MRVLLTAFDAYGEWDQNSSWLAMVELLKQRPDDIELVTRRYPVNLAAVQKQMQKDLAAHYDAILHLGQSPGAAAFKLEKVALNFGGSTAEIGGEFTPLVQSAPLAFQSSLPVGRWAQTLRQHDIPAVVSYHAGMYLCNAIMYLTHYWFHARQQPAQVGFVHLPLAPQQVANQTQPLPSMSLELLAAGLRLILADLANHSPRPTSAPQQV